MSFAGDRDLVGNRRRRITRRTHGCHLRNKTSSVIRHARHLGLANASPARPLVVTMIELPLGRTGDSQLVEHEQVGVGVATESALERGHASAR
jgi:hypothetical protein